MPLTPNQIAQREELARKALEQAGYPKIHCQDRVFRLCEHLKIGLSPDPLEAAIIVALVILAGREDAQIEASMVHDLADLMRRLGNWPPNHLWLRADDLLVPLLMGWRPVARGPVPSGAAPFAGVTPGVMAQWEQMAVSAFRAYIFHLVNWVLNRLKDGHRFVLGFGAWMSGQQEKVEEWTDDILLRLRANGPSLCECCTIVKGAGVLLGVPTGPLRSAAKIAFETCRKNHNLNHFDPLMRLDGKPIAALPVFGANGSHDRYTVWKYVARAVVGNIPDLSKGLPIGFLPNGMLYFYLNRDAGLDVGGLCRKYCEVCNKWTVKHCERGDCGLGPRAKAEPVCGLLKPWLYLPGSGWFRETSFYQCANPECAHSHETRFGHYHEATVKSLGASGFRCTLTVDDVGPALGALAREIRKSSAPIGSLIREGQELKRCLDDWESTGLAPRELGRVLVDRINEIITGPRLDRRLGGSSKLLEGDLIDVRSLDRRLKKPFERPFDEWLARQLSPTTMTARTVCEAVGSDVMPLRHALLQDLNGMLGGESIFDEDLFRHSSIELRPETREVMMLAPGAVEHERLNRMLFEDAYPLEISRNLGRRWGKARLSPDAAALLDKTEMTQEECELLKRWVFAISFPALIPPPKPRELRSTVNEFEIRWGAGGLRKLAEDCRGGRGIPPNPTLANLLEEHLSGAEASPSRRLKAALTTYLNGLIDGPLLASGWPSVVTVAANRELWEVLTRYKQLEDFLKDGFLSVDELASELLRLLHGGRGVVPEGESLTREAIAICESIRRSILELTKVPGRKVDDAKSWTVFLEIREGVEDLWKSLVKEKRRSEARIHEVVEEMRRRIREASGCSEAPERLEGLRDLANRLLLEHAFPDLIEAKIPCPRCGRRSAKIIDRPAQGMTFSLDLPPVGPPPPIKFTEWAPVGLDTRKDFYEQCADNTRGTPNELFASPFIKVLRDGPDRHVDPRCAVMEIAERLGELGPLLGGLAAVTEDQVSGFCCILEDRLEEYARSKVEWGTGSIEDRNWPTDLQRR